jgi:hypothetical protein
LCNDSNNERVYCTLCTGEFSVAHKGKGDIEENVKTAKHRSAINATASALRLLSNFKNMSRAGPQKIW